MNVGYAYMGIAGILIIAGALMGFNGIDPYGYLLLLVSLPLIYYGSKEMADARTEDEPPEVDAE
jgi:uncharacterized membrane protein